MTSEGSNGAITLEVDEGEEEKFGELVEVFPMSGGGGGAGSKFSKNKYKSEFNTLNVSLVKPYHSWV